MKNVLYIEGRRNGYSPDQCGTTFTVSEMVRFLRDFDEETPVYFNNDDGYTYGGVTSCRFSTKEFDFDEYDNEEDDDYPTRSVVVIEDVREGYGVDQIDYTMTVGELIEYLEDWYDEDTPIYISNDNGYTYGNITWGSFECEELEDEDDYDDED